MSGLLKGFCFLCVRWTAGLATRSARLIIQRIRCLWEATRWRQAPRLSPKVPWSRRLRWRSLRQRLRGYPSMCRGLPKMRRTPGIFRRSPARKRRSATSIWMIWSRPWTRLASGRRRLVRLSRRLRILRSRRIFLRWMRL